MKVIFKCNSMIVNQHSEGGRYNGYNNPFGEHIPAVGDCVLLGEHTKEFTHMEYTPMKKYIVLSRNFSAVEDYNNCYSEQTCVVELKHLENAVISY